MINGRQKELDEVKAAAAALVPADNSDDLPAANYLVPHEASAVTQDEPMDEEEEIDEYGIDATALAVQEDLVDNR